MRKCILAGFLIINAFWVAGQETNRKPIQPEFYQALDKDSIAIFFNDRYHLTEKACVKNVRLVKLNMEGQFEGYFEDYTMHDQLLGRGNYSAGEKNGFFEIFYRSGGLKLKGVYKKDKPAEQWEYYYENGLLERRLQFTAADTLLMDYIDSTGNVIVKNGNGRFRGPVNSLVGASEFYIVAEGLVVNGKPHGNWVGMAGEDWLFCNEEFELGKFLGGTSPGSKRKKSDHFKHLTRFILKDYFRMLENFYAEKCADSSRYNYKPRSTKNIQSQKFDVKKFRSSLNQTIKRSLEHDVRINPSQDYPSGDYYLTIRFSTNKEGKPGNLILVSSWGSQVFDDLKMTLNTQTTFPGNQKEVYFHMKFSFLGGGTYTYQYAFSSSATNQL